MCRDTPRINLTKHQLLCPNLFTTDTCPKIWSLETLNDFQSTRYELLRSSIWVTDRHIHEREFGTTVRPTLLHLSPYCSTQNPFFDQSREKGLRRVPFFPGSILQFPGSTESPWEFGGRSLGICYTPGQKSSTTPNWWSPGKTYRSRLIVGDFGTYWTRSPFYRVLYWYKG